MKYSICMLGYYRESGEDMKYSALYRGFLTEAGRAFVRQRLFSP